MELSSECPLLLLVSSQIGKLFFWLTGVLEITTFPALNIHAEPSASVLSWNENKSAEDEKLTFHNIMKITHLEGIHLVEVFFFWTCSLGESHCAAANSKKCLFSKSPLESGSKAFSSQLNLWLKYLILAPSHMRRSSLLCCSCFHFPSSYICFLLFSLFLFHCLSSLCSPLFLYPSPILLN